MAVAMTASQAQEPAEGRVSTRATFESLNPATGQPIATFPIHQRADADVAVSRARDGRPLCGPAAPCAARPPT
jgi:acyl-CoA reductase-like NAD-dependent aldehyde dehydrogenase